MLMTLLISHPQMFSISLLKPKKAACPDSITAEHLLHGPVSQLARRLAPVFQAMLNLRCTPSCFNISHCIPLLKSRDSDPSNPSNYRGISISSVFSKVFESILLNKFMSFLSDQLHPLQGGFRKGLSSSHTSFILQEAIQGCRETHSKCYVAFLDARKAFDTVCFVPLVYTSLISGQLDGCYVSSLHSTPRCTTRSAPFPLIISVFIKGYLHPKIDPFLMCCNTCFNIISLIAKAPKSFPEKI